MKAIDVGNKLRILRHEADFNQQEVAEKLGINKSLYCRMELNEKSQNLDELNILCDLYTIKINDFYQMECPASHTVVISKSMLDNLEKLIE
ncbi:helix-turn-helix transcriptional regulator [Anaerostipes caccae]|uniref:helix-turn-helix transcriptional regulator n=1 Tax=Anaerostipes caccae TaxID=105841 RepID=UPI003995D6BF